MRTLAGQRLFSNGQYRLSGERLPSAVFKHVIGSGVFMKQNTGRMHGISDIHAWGFIFRCSVSYPHRYDHPALLQIPVFHRSLPAGRLPPAGEVWRHGPLRSRMKSSGLRQFSLYSMSMRLSFLCGFTVMMYFNTIFRITVLSIRY